MLNPFFLLEDTLDSLVRRLQGSPEVQTRELAKHAAELTRAVSKEFSSLDKRLKLVEARLGLAPRG